jgi:ubiquinone/menaquinone biosynthesis C-methylase UbiE
MNQMTLMERSDFEQRRQEWRDRVAQDRVARCSETSAYKRSLVHVLRGLVPAGTRVMYLGAAEGNILAALAPKDALGIEPSAELVARGQQRNPGVRFRVSALDELPVDETFDYIVAPDVMLDAYDVEELLTQLRRTCGRDGRLILTNYNQVWRPILKLARLFGLAKPRFGSTWFSPHDMRNAFHATGFEVIRESAEILLPVNIPLLSAFANRFLARLPVFRWFTLHRVYVARPAPDRARPEPIVSVVVPARNESGNIERILREIPQMGAGTEIIFVEGNSTDDTWEVLERVVREANSPRVRLLKQPGKGKGDAVRAGFAAATGDVFMILDADLTVPAEMLPRFYNAIQSGRAEFANGTRLVYAMDQRAMQFLNLLANHFFAWAFSYVLGQPVRDTLCGTKVLRREAYDKIVANRAYFGDFDPFGDFDLLFGAARLNLRIMDVPIRYRERVYGETNISRFRHGALLFRMLAVAALKLKFT